MTKLLQPNSIPTPVDLAGRLMSKLKHLSVTAAMFVQQIHYWICKESGELHKGKRWIYNAFSKWQKQFPWLTDYAWRKIKRVLSELGIIQAEQLGLRQEGRDRSLWYTINYNHEYLKNSTDGNVEFQQIQSLTINECIYVTETTSEISSDTTTAVVIELEEDSQESNLEPPVESKDIEEFSSVEPEELGDETFSAAAAPSLSEPKILQLEKIKDLGISLSPKLRKLVLEETVAVIDNAIAAYCEQEQKGEIREPTAFMIRAIEGHWQPALSTSKHQEVSDFNDWYALNKHLVSHSCSDTRYTGLLEGQVGVMLHGSDQWVYWREVK